ncbi:MAG: helix-turn-helix transcriptional regulator [bacterium]|nr:helix-turn-helix transcriptional regulator [bacterium]
MATPGDAAPLLTELAYEAPDHPEGWTCFLGRLGEVLRGVLPGVFVHEIATDRPRLAETRDHDPTWKTAYEEHYARLDLRRRRIRTLPADTSFVGSALVPDAALESSEFYADFLRPQGLFHLAGGVALRTPDELGVIRVVRPRHAPPFDADDVALLDAILPHVGRALDLQRRLDTAEARRDERLHVLDCLPGGVLLIDTTGRLHAANAVAEALLASRDGLVLENGRVRTLDATDHGHLQALIAVAAPTGATARTPPHALPIRRRTGERTLVLVVAPLRGALLRGTSANASVVIFVNDLAATPAGDPTALEAHLGLSPAEARLTLALARGATVAEAARTLGVTEHTARTQLKRALARTQTRRQAELVRLAITSPALLGPRRR